MIENNVNVCVGMTAIHPNIEQKILIALENQREHTTVFNQVHYNTGGATRIFSNEEFLNECLDRMIEYRLNFKQMFEQQYLNNIFADGFDRNVNFNDFKDRLDQREMSREEFKKEILSRSRPKNDWFRKKHEKKDL